VIKGTEDTLGDIRQRRAETNCVRVDRHRHTDNHDQPPGKKREIQVTSRRFHMLNATPGKRPENKNFSVRKVEGGFKHK
jgi:hypothetical protein